MVGILLLIFTKSSLVPLISELNISTCKTGFAMGMLGNKGYCICQFNFNGKYFGFCSGHLCAGDTKVNLDQRQKELKVFLNLVIIILRKIKLFRMIIFLILEF